MLRLTAFDSHRNSQVLLAGLLLSLMAFASANRGDAATISWIGPTSVLDGSSDSQVLNTGETFVAENYGGSSIVLNGVNFVGASAGSQTTIAAGIGAGVSVFYTGANATMASLLNPAFIDSNGGSPGYAMQLNGLTVGVQYAIQLFGGDERPFFPNPIEVSDGSGSFAFKWGFPALQNDGSYIDGTFTADNTSQSFSVRRDPSAGGSGGAILAGINVQVVPEPSTAVLFGLGLAGLGWGGRTRKF